MYFQKYFNMAYNKGPDFGDNMANVEEALKYWSFKEARDTVRLMVTAYGKPRSMSICDAKWEYLGGLTKVCVKDESIPHGDHSDFLYGCRQIAVPPDLYTPIAQSSDSIMIDGQKGMVIARCNQLYVIAIMLKFVEDVVQGATKATPEELDRRIENGEVPEWFEDKMGEILGESINESVSVSVKNAKFKKSDFTKQTKDRVMNDLKDAEEMSKKTGTTKTGMLDIFYGDKVGPANFVFKNGKLSKIESKQQLPPTIVFAVK